MNHDLSNLINVWSGLDRDAPVHPRMDDRSGLAEVNDRRPPWWQQQGRYLTSQAWASANAFMARLHSAAPDLTHLDLRGMFAMIEALEKPLSPSQLEDVLPAAAAWMVHAGSELRNNKVPHARYDFDNDRLRSPWSKGPWWMGQRGFNEERWDFWMRKFKEISEQTDVTLEILTAASRALETGRGLK